MSDNRNGPPRKPRRRKKPPRMVLLDTRQLAELDDLVVSLSDAIGRLNWLQDTLLPLGEAVRELLPIVSQLHAAQQARSAAAKKAAAARKTTPAPCAGSEPPPVPAQDNSEEITPS